MPDQPSLIPDQPPNVKEQIAELERENNKRRQVYPKLVSKGTLTQALSDYRIRCLEETIGILKQLARLDGPEFGKRE